MAEAKLGLFSTMSIGIGGMVGGGYHCCGGGHGAGGMGCHEELDEEEPHGWSCQLTCPARPDLLCSPAGSGL